MPPHEPPASNAPGEAADPAAESSSMAFATQEGLAHRLRASIDALERQVDAVVRPLTPSQRAAHPPDGGWSVDQILEHLCRANADYLDAMERALARASPPRKGGTWRATLGGWLLVKAMESDFRSSAPARIVPPSTPRDAVLDAMFASLHRLRHLIARASATEWRRVRLASPYARWLRLNFGDAALVVVRHGERHARQMARVTSTVEG